MPNFESRRLVWETAPDDSGAELHHRRMDKNDVEDWYLRDWMKRAGKRQASMIKELGWDKAKANFVFHSKQAYRRDLVNEVAAWLKIRPYELLMPPDEAMALRNLRTTARAIAEDAANFQGFDHELPARRSAKSRPK